MTSPVLVQDREDWEVASFFDSCVDVSNPLNRTQVSNLCHQCQRNTEHFVKLCAPSKPDLHYFGTVVGIAHLLGQFTLSQFNSSTCSLVLESLTNLLHGIVDSFVATFGTSSLMLTPSTNRVSRFNLTQFCPELFGGAAAPVILDCCALGFFWDFHNLSTSGDSSLTSLAHFLHRFLIFLQPLIAKRIFF